MSGAGLSGAGLSGAGEPLVVPSALDGERVDRAVTLLTGWSRADVGTLIGEGSVLVNGQAVMKSRRLAAGDVIDVLAEPTVPGPPQAEPIPLVVIYEDDELIVVDKPAGLVVHPGAGHPDGTLVNALLARYPEIAAVGDPMRPGLVHRLDRDTSGLLVVARTPATYDALVALLTARAVERKYEALVWGVPQSRRGMVDAPIGRSVRAPTRMAIREGGREARTSYAVVRSFADPAVSLLECALETGRTHQIRVHLAAIDHPIVGDVAYGGGRAGVAITRPFLHAGSLAFVHPATGVPLQLTSALPDDLRDVLDALVVNNPD